MYEKNTSAEKYNENKIWLYMIHFIQNGSEYKENMKNHFLGLYESSILGEVINIKTSNFTHLARRHASPC